MNESQGALLKKSPERSPKTCISDHLGSLQSDFLRTFLTAMDRKLVLLLILRLAPQFTTDEDSFDKKELELRVVTNSTSCSVTCGIGMKTQTVCTYKHSNEMLHKKPQDLSEEDQKTEKCHNEQVRCQEFKKCGIKTVTKTVGEMLELDCLFEKTILVNRLSWRVSWYYAPGVISSDDKLFMRFASPQLDLLILDPIKEEHAGTYRCDVLDLNSKMLKSVYWGVRVLPSGFINLDYEHAQSMWNTPWNEKTDIVSNRYGSLSFWVYIMLAFLSLLNIVGVLVLVLKIWAKRGTYKIPEDENSAEAMTEI
ncbi:transmembrane protein 81 isoform X1 [Syngnathus scovelli]|uniref:transmembrane protein 81 isoform X1 n=2 Tax=Syngnathus scovelli TaxID=161590 RepID=UPI00210F659A|nr:transmembrane protein 81 isoform X1 [Syngnathus scovelli]